MWVEQASARRVTALMHGLGPDGALYRALRPDDWMWTAEHELLALNAELTDALYRAFIRANSREGSQQPKPVKIPRPGQQNRRQRGTTLAELTQMMH